MARRVVLEINEGYGLTGLPAPDINSSLRLLGSRDQLDASERLYQPFGRSRKKYTLLLLAIGPSYPLPAASRRDGRVVEGGGLENRFPETGRGFESYSLRQKLQHG